MPTISMCYDVLIRIFFHFQLKGKLDYLMYYILSPYLESEAFAELKDTIESEWKIT
jgi:hypothetical protein